jgi:DNA-binding MarR family transcriptional regulator
MDFVTDLGPAFVAHRLRRLSDRIVDEIAGALSVQGLSVPPRSASTILLLAKRGPQGPVEIARALRFSHPLMVRALRVLEELGLVQAVDHSGDQRRRLVELTQSGHHEAAVLTRFNERLNRVMREVLDDAGGDGDAFLETLEAIGRTLDRQPISARLNMEEHA